MALPMNNDFVPYDDSSEHKYFEEKSLLLRVNAPGHDEAGTAKVRDIQVPRAVNVGAFSMTHAKAPQKVTITVEYKVLKPNTGAPFAQIFKIIDTD